MKVILFSKMFKEHSIAELIETGHDLGIEGYDLAVRPGYAIGPDNAGSDLKEAVEAFEGEGLSIPMVTGNFDLMTPDHPTAIPLLWAMDAANVRLLKLGYFKFDPVAQDYWQEVDRIREALEGWQKLGREHNVKICYHTHSNHCMGLNAGMLAHLIRGFDPDVIGAYLDPGHMAVEGEAFDVGAGMVGNHLAIIGAKDVLQERVDKDGHGAARTTWVKAGEGLVDWTTILEELVRLKFDGPLSVHCEFEVPAEEFLDAVRREVTFFKTLRDRVAA